MKKISKKQPDATVVAGKPVRVVGLDLGDRHSYCCMLSNSGEEMETWRIPTTRAAIEKHFGSEPRMRIALEAGTHSPWVSRLLKARTPGNRSEPTQDSHGDKERQQERCPRCRAASADGSL